MKKIARHILVVLAGIIVGSIVNMGLVQTGLWIIPLPQGADVSTMEALQESMSLFSPVNFIFPLLAHAIGTLAGAFIAARFAASHSMTFAMIIGGVFLLGGISVVSQTGGPLWFIITDLLLAYIPMAYVGALLARTSRRRRSSNVESAVT